MRFLIPAYAVAFLFVTVVSLRENLADKEPRWVIGGELVLASLTLTGYFAHHLDARDPTLVGLWRGIAPALAAGYGFLFYRDLRDLEPSPDFSPTENVWICTIATWISVIFMVPAIWSNLLLAYR